MKQTPKSSIRTVVSSREALALATFFTIAHASAAEAPAKKEEAAADKKKKGEESDVLPEINVQATRQTPYNPQNVQSPRFTAPLVNTPQTVTVVPKEVYTQQAAQNLSDVLKNTPGITFQAGEGGNPTSGDGTIRMRGFDASNSVFVDGVRDSGQQDRDIFNIEQVEVARGPAGADVGRTTAAGYINLSTKAPLLEEFVRGTTSYYFDETDADGNFRQTLDYNTALSKLPMQGAAFRFNGLFQEGGVTGRELAESNRWSVAPSFAVGLGTDSRFIFQFQYTKQNNIPDYGLVRAALDSEDGNGSYTPRPYSTEQDTSYGADYAFEDVESISGTIRVEHDFTPDILFSNQTRFSQNNRSVEAVAPTSYTQATRLVGRNFTANDRDTENFSNIATVRSEFKTGFVEHVLSTGLEVTHEESRSYSYFGGTVPAVILSNPSHTVGPTLRPAKNGGRTVSRVDTVSLNAFETAKFNEQWELIGGVRAEYYDLDYQSRSARANVASTGGADTRVKTDDTLVDWKIGMVYKPRQNGSVYVSYGHSEQNPGTNLNLSASTTGTGADNVNSDPQEAENFEVGTKWNWFDDKLSTTFAVFKTKQKNIGVATDAVTGEIVQTGQQEVKGAEISITGQITDNWAVFGGIGYADSENSNPASTAADSAVLQYTPELSGSLWTSYKFDFGLTIGGGVRYQDETSRSLTAVTNGSLAGTDAYWVFDALASYDVTENVTLRFNVNNIFDEHYVRSVNNNGGRYNAGAPRAYVLSADWRF